MQAEHRLCCTEYHVTLFSDLKRCVSLPLALSAGLLCHCQSLLILSDSFWFFSLSSERYACLDCCDPVAPPPLLRLYHFCSASSPHQELLNSSNQQTSSLLNSLTTVITRPFLRDLHSYIAFVQS